MALASATATLREPLVLAGPHGRLWQVMHVLRRKPLGTFGFLLVFVILVLALSAPISAPYKPNAIGKSALEANQGPSAKHWFGTDGRARDMYSRVLYGSRLSLIVGASAMLIAVGFGSLVGLISGYAGGALDLVLQRIVDGLMAFPSVLLLLLLVTIAEPSVLTIIGALGFISMAAVSRVVRSGVLAAKEQMYVTAAQVVGASAVRIMVRHILPNVVGLVIVLFSIGIGGAMLAEASLSFLGLGTPPPDPSLGRMISESRAVLIRYPHLSIFPGLMLSLAVLGFNLAGDALRDILDPRLRIQ